MTRFHSHNQYCDTWRNKHNILCHLNSNCSVEAHNILSRMGDVIGVAFIFATGYCALSIGAILDLIVAGGQ